MQAQTYNRLLPYLLGTITLVLVSLLQSCALEAQAHRRGPASEDAAKINATADTLPAK
jgi:hypothetical protein